MKICLLSDSHDNRDLLSAAGRQAVAAGAQAILHCGDVVAAGTLTVLQPLGVPVHVIHGNNAGDPYTMHRVVEKSQGLFTYHGMDASLHLGGRNIFMVHYPHYARAMALTGDWDIVCFGHDHVAAIEYRHNIKGRETVLLNPGTVAGIGADPTYLMADLEQMDFRIHELQDDA